MLDYHKQESEALSFHQLKVFRLLDYMYAKKNKLKSKMCMKMVMKLFWRWSAPSNSNRKEIPRAEI